MFSGLLIKSYGFLHSLYGNMGQSTLTLNEHRAFRAWLKRKVMCVAGLQKIDPCIGVPEIHHLRKKNTGMGRKPPDIEDGICNIVPLCTFHHQQFHALGRHTFCKKYDLNLFEVAKTLLWVFQASKKSG